MDMCAQSPSCNFHLSILLQNIVSMHRFNYIKFEFAETINNWIRAKSYFSFKTNKFPFLNSWGRDNIKVFLFFIISRKFLVFCIICVMRSFFSIFLSTLLMFFEQSFIVQWQTLRHIEIVIFYLFFITVSI